MNYFKNKPLSKHAMLLQRLRNVVQTSWTFGQRCLDIVLISYDHSASIKSHANVLGQMKNA